MRPAHTRPTAGLFLPVPPDLDLPRQASVAVANLAITLIPSAGGVESYQ